MKQDDNSKNVLSCRPENFPPYPPAPPPPPSPPPPPPTPAPFAPMAVDMLSNGSLANLSNDASTNFACTYEQWSRCVKSKCSNHDSCNACVTTTGGSITCGTDSDSIYTTVHIPAGMILPLTKLFVLPPNMTLSGAANPQPADKTIQPTNVSEQSWFVVPTDKKNSSLVCHSDTSTLTSIVMNTNTMLQNLNIQGRSIQRPSGNGMCNALVLLPGMTEAITTTGFITKASVPPTPIGAITNVRISNVRLNGASATNPHSLEFHDLSPFGLVVLPADAPHMVVAQTRADGVNIHGDVENLNISNSLIMNTNNDCIAFWANGTKDALLTKTTSAFCGGYACLALFAYESLVVDDFECFPSSVTRHGRGEAAIMGFYGFHSQCMGGNASLTLSGTLTVANSKPTDLEPKPPCKMGFSTGASSCATTIETLCSGVSRYSTSISPNQTDLCFQNVCNRSCALEDEFVTCS